MTLDEAIDRMIDLRRITGGDVQVTKSIEGGSAFEVAGIEVQQVLPTEFAGENGETQWRCGEGMVNTLKIISVF